MGSTLKSLTISSTSGTYNEVLLTNVTNLVVNDYKGYLVYYSARKITYEIASNTATTITLNTPTASYFDLTGKDNKIIIPSDYFGLDANDTFPDINASLHINATDKMTTELTASDLKRMLPLIEGYIHHTFNFETPLTESEIGYEIIRNVILSLLMRWNRRRQYNKLTNQLELVQDAYIPDLSLEEVQKLTAIKSKDDHVCGVFDTNFSNGRRINVGDYYWRGYKS